MSVSPGAEETRPRRSLRPAGSGRADLRYRLWDIDLIIRRTLVYSLLTGVLALIYFSSVIVLEELVRVVTGRQHSEIVIITTTLAIAALFTPLRWRIQTVIDRRIYRQKVNAALAIAAFATTARDEVALNVLAAELLHTVEETMHPEHVSLWLREPLV